MGADSDLVDILYNILKDKDTGVCIAVANGRRRGGREPQTLKTHLFAALLLPFFAPSVFAGADHPLTTCR